MIYNLSFVNFFFLIFLYVLFWRVVVFFDVYIIDILYFFDVDCENIIVINEIIIIICCRVCEFCSNVLRFFFGVFWFVFWC